MKFPKSFFQQIPFYPVLFGLYPVLFLWVANFAQIQPFVVLRPLIFSLSFTTIVCLACLAVQRNLQKAALLAGLSLVLFFSYGQVYTLASFIHISGLQLVRHRFLVPFWVVLWATGTYGIFWTQSDLRNLTRALNLVSGLLVLLSLGQIVFLMFKTGLIESSINAQVEPAAATSQIAELNLPDVYYIILDGYEREDLMRDDIQYNNHAFITQLKELGFIVPDCTQSNYNTTSLSIASSLNLDYLDKLGITYSELSQIEKHGWALTGLTIQPYIMENQVMKQFKEMGYRIITLKTGYTFIDFPKSDINYDYETSLSVFNRVEAINFQTLFMKTTLMRVVIEESEHSPIDFKKLPEPILQLINPDLIWNPTSNPNYPLYQRDLYHLDMLDKIAQVPGKKFLYAHLLATHGEPYIFTQNGELLPAKEDTNQDYEDAVIYTNQRILTLVKNIIAQSNPAPVIILQGDHARVRGEENSFKILNAYYLPEKDRGKISPHITPVNTFRMIFSLYFNKDYPLLPDQAIWVDSKYPNGYKIVPGTCINIDKK